MYTFVYGAFFASRWDTIRYIYVYFFVPILARNDSIAILSKKSGFVVKSGKKCQ